MDPADLLDLFDRLVARTTVALTDLDDWGPSGERVSQYRHDVVADEIIVGGLREAGLRVLSEETGLQPERADDGMVTVVVDPVDGSTNGSRGLPWYAASLCAVDADGPLASVVVNLASGVRYRAIRGSGARVDRLGPRVGGSEPEGAGSTTGEGPGGVAFADARPVRPSTCTRLDDAIIGFSGLPPAPGGWRQFRALGAAALDLCAVADGTLDGYVDVDRAHGVWDYLGALLVCSEAGVPMVDHGGEGLVVLDPAARRGPVAGATGELTEALTAMVETWAAAG